jgi:hypothetical protein
MACNKGLTGFRLGFELIKTSEIIPRNNIEAFALSWMFQKL